MKCNSINCNQPSPASYNFTKKCDGADCKKRELSPYDGTKKLAVAGGVLALATHGLAYGVVRSSLAGFKNRGRAATADKLRGYQAIFSKATDMSKTTCSKFIKNTMKDIATPKTVLRSAYKGMLIGALVGLLCDSARRYAADMDYKSE